MLYMIFVSFLFFFFTSTATTDIYTLSLHDALPILQLRLHGSRRLAMKPFTLTAVVVLSGRSRSSAPALHRDRKSTRLNSSHQIISYAVFCLKKKKKNNKKICLHDTLTTLTLFRIAL